jgi:hypothetical protein
MIESDIKALLKLDDTGLAEILGFNRKVAAFREDLQEADKLTGKAREEVQERVDEMLTPNVYPGDLGYAIERATRKKQSGKEALADCSCTSVMD